MRNKSVPNYMYLMFLKVFHYVFSSFKNDNNSKDFELCGIELNSNFLNCILKIPTVRCLTLISK